MSEDFEECPRCRGVGMWKGQECLKCMGEGLIVHVCHGGGDEDEANFQSAD